MSRPEVLLAITNSPEFQARMIGNPPTSIEFWEINNANWWRAADDLQVSMNELLINSTFMSNKEFQQGLELKA